MKRDLPLHVEDHFEDESPRSLLASRAFWIGAALSVIAWGLLGAWLLR